MVGAMHKENIMALTHVQKGGTITITNSTGSTILSGTPVVVGDILVVATVDIPDGLSGEAVASEVHALPKKTDEVIAQGTDLYWDVDGNPEGGVAGSGCLTATVADILVGPAWAAAGADDMTIPVKLNS